MLTGLPSCSDSSVIAFLQAVIASLLGRILIDANAAAAHLVHHRQQIDVETIGGAGALAVEDRIEALKKPQGGDRICLGVAADIARRHLPNVRL